MKNTLRDAFVIQIKRGLEAVEEARSRAKFNDLSDLNGDDHLHVITLLRGIVTRVAGTKSEYAAQVREVLEGKSQAGYKAVQLKGVATALLADLEAGTLDSLAEHLHGEVFADFLEMARYLSEEGFKDAAAVLAGGTLEAHLRQLCQKFEILTDLSTAKGVTSKRADQMNADLSSADAYSKLDLKSVTAWLDLRNKAAHARYGEYTAEQVSLMIEGVRDFIARNPA